MTRELLSLLLLGLSLVLPQCSGSQGTKTNNGKVAAPVDPLADIEQAARILPPAALAVMWLDMKALREADLVAAVEEYGKQKGSTLPFGSLMGGIDRVAAGIYPSKSMVDPLLVARVNIPEDDLFAQAKEWAKSSGFDPVPLELGGRRALKVKDTLLARLSGDLYACGPEPLVAWTIDLLEQKKTTSACTTDLKYLRKKTLPPGAAFSGYATMIPQANKWLKDKRVESLIASRFLLSIEVGSEVGLTLGILPGGGTRPIWAADEMNSFFARASKSNKVKNMGMGLAEWLDTLEVKLLDKGIVVKGALAKERFLGLAKMVIEKIEKLQPPQ